MANCGFNINCFRPSQLSASRPLEYNIGSALWKFLQVFWLNGKNILEAPVINNELFFRGPTAGNLRRPDIRPVDAEIIGLRHFERQKWLWLSIKFKDLLNNDLSIKSYESLLVNTGLIFNFNCYLNLRTMANFALRKYRKLLIDTGTGTNRPLTINFFLLARGKNSRPFRRLLSNKRVEHSSGMAQIHTLSRLIDFIVPAEKLCKQSIGYWNSYFLPVTVKTFCLNFFRNTLPVNARIGGRYRGGTGTGTVTGIAAPDERCRLCKKVAGNAAHAVIAWETFQHFFWDCCYTKNMLDIFRQKYAPNITAVLIKRLFFLSINADNEYCSTWRLISILFFFEIWKARNGNTLPAYATIEYNMVNTCNKIKDCYRYFFDHWYTNENLWCRRWWPEHGGRRG
jgi:hypothetical protein